MKIRLLFLSLLFTWFASAQKGFDVQISSKKIEVGEELIVQYTLHNLNAKKLAQPNFGGLQVTGGPQQSQSTNIQIVNGSFQEDKSISYTYALQASKPGTYKIGKAAVITTDNQTYETGEITIEVVKASPQNAAAGTPGAPGAPSSSGNVDLSKEIFSKIILNKSDVYVGEQITATIKVYTSVNLNGFEPTKVPNFNGFWSQDIKLPQEIKPKQEVLNGKPYLTFEVKKIILFPTKEGTLEITPLEVKTTALVPVQVQRRKQNRQPRDWFEYMEMQMEEMMGGMSQYQVQQIPYAFTTGTAKIKIKALPEKNKPADFNGAVGSFAFKSNIDKKTCKTDDAISYKLTLEGAGNLPLIEMPKPEFSKDFELYDPITKDNFSTNEVFSGSKNMEIIAIPHMPGKYKLEPVQFSYFDPNKKTYITLTSEGYPLEITGKPSVNSAYVSGNTDKEDTKLIGKDIRYIHDKKEMVAEQNHFLGSGWYGAFTVLPGILFAVLLAVRRRQNDLENDVVYMGNKRATKIARARLASANKFLLAHDKQNFYNELVRGIWSYIGNKCQIDPANLSRENIRETLLAKQAQPEVIQQTQEILEVCEMSLFSPVSGDDMQKTYESAVKLITSLESQLKS